MNQADEIASTTNFHAQLANYSLQLDYIQGQLFSLQTQVNHSDAYMKTHFRQVKGSIDHLTIGMSLLYFMVNKINTTTTVERTFFERGSCGGGEGGSGSGNGSGNGDQGKGEEDPNAERAKSVEDSSIKGEKPQNKSQDESGSGKDKGAEDSGRDKGKGKQALQSSDEDYYYQGEQDDFDAFNIQEEEQEEVGELPGVNEYEEEGSFDDWEEGELPSDPKFNEDFKKQQMDLRRKEDELEKISQVIMKKAELLKAENEEKQRIHNLKIK